MYLKCSVFDYKTDLEKQRVLFADAFSEVDDKSVETYNWLFRQFPGNNKNSYEYCSFIGDEMVGYYAALPYPYKIAETQTEAAMVCGVMTSSKHRGKGIFTQLGRFSTSELANYLPFTTGYPIRKGVIPGHLKVGWKIAFELPLYIKFLRSDSILASKKLSIFKFIANPLLALYNSLRKTSTNSKYSIEIYNDINQISGYDTFVHEWLKSVSNGLIKDIKFANWRYGRPGSNYNFVTIWNTGRLVGFASYCKTKKEGVPSYCVLDLFTLPNYKDCVCHIYRFLTTDAKKEEIEAIMFMMSKHSAKYYRVTMNGFFRSPYRFSLIIKNLTDQFSDEILMNEKNWHLMWVDSDDL